MNLKQLYIFGMENSQEPVIKNPVLRAALEGPSITAQEPRIGFYKGESVVKSHGDKIIQLGEVGESSVSIAKKLRLKQQTVNDAINSIEKGLAGKKYKFSKPFKDIIKSKEARIAGWKKRKKIPIEDIRKNLIKNEKKVTMVNNKFIFADEKMQQEFLDDMLLRYKYPRTSTAATQAGYLTNEQIFKKYFEGTYKKSGIHDLIFRFKRELGLDFSKLPPGERNAHQLRRIAKLLISQAGKRISGLDDFPAHHLYPIGDEFAHGTQDFTIIDKKTNSQLSGSNKQLVGLAEQRSQLINDVQTGKISPKNFNIEIGKLDTKATFIIKKHYKKFPKHDGLLNWRKATSVLDEQGKFKNITSTGSIGGDASKWAITDINKQIKDLSKTELATFRSEVKKQAEVKKRAFDLSTAEGRLLNRQTGTAKILNKILENNKIYEFSELAKEDPAGFLKAVKEHELASKILNKPGLVKGALRGLSGWIKKESGPTGWIGSIATIDSAFGLYALGQGKTPLQALDETLWFLPKWVFKADERTFKDVYQRAGFTDEDFGEFQKWMKLEDLDQQYFMSQKQLKFMEGQVLGKQSEADIAYEKEVDALGAYQNMGWNRPLGTITSEERETGEHPFYGSAVDRHNKIIKDSQDVYNSLISPEKSQKDLDYSRKFAAMEEANRKKKLMRGSLKYAPSLLPLLHPSSIGGKNFPDPSDFMYDEYVHPIEGPGVSPEQMAAAGFAQGGIASLKKKW